MLEDRLIVIILGPDTDKPMLFSNVIPEPAAKFFVLQT